MTLIAFDFSISKPASIVFSNNEHIFYLWPKEINEKNKQLFKSFDINIMERETIQYSDITKYDIVNADNLSDLIINSLKEYLNGETIIAFEGSSFSSRGNVTLSLTAWRYILIYKLSKIIPIDNIHTYSPITIKSIAGCAKKGMKKTDMINAFIMKGPDCKLREVLRTTPELVQKKGGKNYIDGTDDLIDAFWTLETLRRKENI